MKTPLNPARLIAQAWKTRWSQYVQTKITQHNFRGLFTILYTKSEFKFESYSYSRFSVLKCFFCRQKVHLNFLDVIRGQRLHGLIKPLANILHKLQWEWKKSLKLNTTSFKICDESAQHKTTTWNKYWLYKCTVLFLQGIQRLFTFL